MYTEKTDIYLFQKYLHDSDKDKFQNTDTFYRRSKNHELSYHKLTFQLSLCRSLCRVILAKFKQLYFFNSSDLSKIWQIIENDG